MTDTILYIALIAGALALVLAVFYARAVMAAPRGNERMVELSTAIREGAMAFLKREYTWVSVFVLVMAILIARQDRVLFVNMAAEHLLGYSMQEMRTWQQNECFRTLVYPEDLPFVRRYAMRRHGGSKGAGVAERTWRAVARSGAKAAECSFTSSNTVLTSTGPVGVSTVQRPSSAGRRSPSEIRSVRSGCGGPGIGIV